MDWEGGYVWETCFGGHALIYEEYLSGGGFSAR